MYNRLLLLTIFIVAHLMTGCAINSGTPLTSTEIATMNSQPGTSEYLLAAGDTLSIKFFFNPKLNDEVTIMPDGKISLHLLGTVQAAGLTSSQLAANLKKEYSRVLLKNSDNAYVFGIGDTVAVKFFYNDFLNDELIVTPDGKITLQLVGTVQAAGLTPSQLSADLRKKYADILESPEVTVIVRNFTTPEVAVTVKDSVQRVYVGGEVAKPGLVPIKGMLRTLDAIVLSGGALPNGVLSSVILLRYNGTQTPEVYTVDGRSILAGETPDVFLKPYDIVYVPKTGIAEIRQIMDQIYNSVPPVLFTFPYYLNREVMVTKE